MEKVRSTSKNSHVGDGKSDNVFLKADIDLIVEREGFITSTSEIKKLAADGGNYMADLFDVKIKGETEVGPKELNLFVKNKLQHTMIAFSNEAAYSAETFAYRELFPVYKELENEFDVPKSERYRSVKYYDTGNENVIIMENIAKQGYKVLNRLEIVSLQYAELGVLELAKFHALSFAVEKHRPELFKKLSTIRFPMTFNDDYYNFAKNSVQQGLELIEPSKKDKLEKRVLELVQNLELQFNKKENSVNCLCHNDFRIANIMYTEQDGEITDLIPLDFQLMAPGSPLNDFFFFLLSPTDKTFRGQHLDNLKEYYYNNLGKYLHNFKMDIKEVYNKDEFEKDYIRFRVEYGLPITMTLLPYHLMPVNDVPDMSKQDVTKFSIVKHDVLIDRVNDLLDDFIGWGYF